MRAVDFNSMVKGDTDMTQQEMQMIRQMLDENRKAIYNDVQGMIQST